MICSPLELSLLSSVEISLESSRKNVEAGIGCTATAKRTAQENMSKSAKIRRSLRTYDNLAAFNQNS